jgi:hypothetical protein
MPSSTSAFAALHTSRCSWPYVSTRESPGSPSQISAALFLRQVVTCRSRQLALAFSRPPTNHFASGSFQSSTCFHGSAHASSLAISAQKPSGSRAARS